MRLNVFSGLRVSHLFVRVVRSKSIIHDWAGDEFLDKLSSLNAAPRPRGRWRSAEDCAAVAGNTLHVDARAQAGVGGTYLDFWPQGMILSVTGKPAEVVLGGLNICKGGGGVGQRRRPSVAAAESDRLPALGKISWRQRGGHPSNPRVCPPQCVVKPGNVRMVRDWPNMA